jgi:F-type H+-transporting ATPase subunit a
LPPAVVRRFFLWQRGLDPVVDFPKMLTISPIASAEEGVSMTAQSIFESVASLRWFTNSIFVTMIVTVFIVVLARRATRRMQLVPTGGQNAFESIIEGLYDTFEGIVGKHMIRHVFSLLATLFIFILAANWFGLLPGVGTIGWGPKSGPLSISHVDHALLRATTADLNMTLAMAALFMVLWLYWSIREVGAGGFLFHIFGPKGGLKGALAIILLPIFLFVGVIEIVSIAFRPVSLSLRLFGNIYAGESLLHAMGSLGDSLPSPFSYILSVILPLPFYFLELLVGLLQALVFTLLCSVYIQLSTSHDDEESHGH